LKKLLPVAVFLAVALVSLVLAGYGYIAGDDAARIKFEATADDAVSRIESRIELHVSLLRATQALFETRGGQVSRNAFGTFFRAFDIDRNYAGLRGIGFLRVARDAAEIETVEREIERQHGIDARIFPVSDAPIRTPVTLLEPLDAASRAGLGYDMYTDAARRQAIDATLATDQVEATGLLTLGAAGGGQTYPGFLIFQRLDLAPDEPEAAPVGLLFLVFRSADLFGAALGRSPLPPVNVEVYEGTPEEGRLMFRSATPPAEGGRNALLVRRDMQVANRVWSILFRPTSAFEPPSSPLVPLLVGLFGLLLAVAVALAARYQSRAYDASAALHEVAERNLVEKDLLLQEMKHRIKNSIARILAIARQTAAGASDINEFSASFASRLQAMAASQDMLTRSRWQKAELGDLLRIELEQVLGKGLPADMLSGPKVLLDESATQALGLTFHELATNAMKYGDIGGLKIGWRVDRNGEERRLDLTWKEGGQGAADAPEKIGFGTRLIDMNITRELKGTIARDFGDGGLKVEISIPLGRR
jgi:CHASE1-domain containing sensor protein